MTNEVLSLDSPELPLSDYRSLREGREVPAAPKETPAADAAEPTQETAADDAGSTETNSKEDSSKDQPKPKGDKLNARFSELTQKIRSLETQLAAKSSAVSTETKSDVKPAEVTIAPDPNDPEPDASRFSDYVEWQKAWNRWDRRQDTRQEKAAAAVAEQQNAAKAKAETWQTRVSEATAELADFAAVAQNPDLPITSVMAEAITDTDIGPRILYHLGKNPAEAARIAKLSPVAAIREIGKIEAALTAADVAADSEDSELEAPPVKKPVVSKAPAPHKPLGGSASSTNPAKQIDSMTQAEYRAYRESGKLR
jgi:hypothetical protein